MKTLDYVVDFFVKKGLNPVFGNTGGNIVHIHDSISKTKGTKTISNHNEQAAGMAADEIL